MNELNDTQRTLGDLTALELVERAVLEVSSAMEVVLAAKVNPAALGAVYAYLFLAQDKLRCGGE